jgi:hypothetical protein
MLRCCARVVGASFTHTDCSIARSSLCMLGVVSVSSDITLLTAMLANVTNSYCVMTCKSALTHHLYVLRLILLVWQQKCTGKVCKLK